MALVKALLEGRVLSALLLILTGILGLDIDAGLKEQIVKLGGTGIPALLLLWSRIQALPGRELYRRLSAGLAAAALPAAYTMIGFVAPELADADRATMAQALVGGVVLALSAASFRKKQKAAP